MRLAAKWRERGTRPRGIAGDEAHLIFGEEDGSDIVRFGQGEPIVLVPGLAGGWRLVEPLARRLANRHEVILVGHRGDHSAFGPARPEGLADYARDLASTIEQLGLERPTVLGVSFGAAVALEMVVSRPWLVGGLIVQGVEARFRETLGATVARRVLERFPLPSDNRFVNQFFNLLHGGRPESGPLAEFVIERCWETDQAVMARRLRALQGFDVTDRLDRIDVPTLVLAGTRDVVVPIARQRALAEAIEGARFAPLDGAGHIGFLTHRDEVARQVQRLVRVGSRSLC